MNTLNNPLRQYFRRPAVYIRLPSEGKYYAPGVIDMPENGELPVFPMTAIDDISARTPDALFNGQAMVDIIKSCVPAIRDPWRINNMDLDAIMLAIKSSSSDSGLNITSKCPSCSTETDYKLDTAKLLSEIKPADYTKPMSVGDLRIFFKPLEYKDINEISLANFQMQKRFGNLDSMENTEERAKATKEALKSITEVTIQTIASCIDHIKTPNDTIVNDTNFILDFLSNCEKTTYDIIQEAYIKLKESGEVKPLNFKCPNCKHEYKNEMKMNLTDFFG